MIWRIFVQYQPKYVDHHGVALESAWRHAGFSGVKKIRSGAAYELNGSLTEKDVTALVEKLLVDPIVQTAQVYPEGKVPGQKDMRRAQIWSKPGVSDPVADTVRVGARDLAIEGLSSVKSGKVYEFWGNPAADEVRSFSEDQLMNPLVQKVEVS